MLGVNLSGAEFGKTHRYGYDYIYPGESEIAFYASRGVELVRLPFKWERMQKVPGGELDPAELGRLKTFLAAAEKQGVEVILDLHNYGRYGSKVLGTPELSNEMFADFWAKLVKAVGSSPAIYGYGLMNEPHDMGGPNVWRDAAQAAVNAIRAIDTTNTIIVAGDGWSSAKNWTVSNKNLLISDPADKLLYEAHVYFDNDGSGIYDGTYDQERGYADIGADRIKPFLQWLEANDVKGFIGEFAVPGNDPRWLAALDKFLATLDELDMPATYWGAGPWFGNYALGLRYANGSERPQLDVLEKYLADPVAKTIQGTAGADTLAGDRGADRMIGAAGDDLFTGSLGADVIDGGTGSDTASYARSLGAVDADLQRAAQLGGLADGDRLVSIENLVGSSYADVLRGGAEANRLSGGAGDDYFEGRGGADTLDGGTGIDVADYSRSAQAVQIDLTAASQRGGDAEGDRLIAVETIIGTAFGDTIVGDGAINRIEGGAGDDLLHAGWRDTVDGGNGSDTLDFSRDDAALTIDLGAGTNNRKAIVSNVEHVVGTGKVDIIIGSSGANILAGGAGDDRIEGGAGNDSLSGGAGRDSLKGGTGADIFAFAAADLGAVDKILDFSRAEGDRINLAAIDANSALAGDQAFRLIGASTFSKAAGELRVTGSGTAWQVHGDVNGDGVVDFQLQVTSTQPIAAADFLF